MLPKDLNIEDVPDKTNSAPNIKNLAPLSNRIEICKSCPELNSLNFCKQCGCFMPVKVRIKSAECPLKKWTKLYDKEPETKLELKKLEIDSVLKVIESFDDNTPLTEKERYNEILKRLNEG